MKSQDICENITAAIIAELEKGVMPWSKPWAGSGRPVMPRRHTGTRYRGINILILWQAAAVGFHAKSGDRQENAANMGRRRAVFLYLRCMP